MKKKIQFKGNVVTGNLALENAEMVCVPAKEHYNSVSLTLRDSMNIQVAEIDVDWLDYENKKILGYEIERRWNANNKDYTKLATEIIRQSESLNINDFDSPHNWLVRCIADANTKLELK